MSHCDIASSTLSDDYGQLVDALCAISERYFYAARLKEALNVLGHGESLIREGGDAFNTQLARLLTQRGKLQIWNSLMGDNCLEEASVSLNRASEIADGVKDRRLQAYAKLHLGHCLDFQKVLLDQGEWSDALEVLHESHDIFLQTDDKVGLCTAEFFIGLIHQRLRQKSEAIAHFEQALALARQNGNKFEEAEAIRHLGFFTFMDGKLDETLDYARTSLRLLEEIDCKIALSSAHHAVGMIQEARGNRQDTLSAYEQAVEIGEKLSLKVPHLQALLGISSIHEKEGRSEDAVQCVTRAKEIARKTGYSVFIKAAESKLEELP